MEIEYECFCDVHGLLHSSKVWKPELSSAFYCMFCMKDCQLNNKSYDNAIMKKQRITDNPWKIEYKDKMYNHIQEGKKSTEVGSFNIFYKGRFYGFVYEDSFDHMNTSETLSWAKKILNDAYKLAKIDYRKGE